MIKYLCHNCSNILNLTGFSAVNEVGRKHCDGCGGNDDNLVVVDSMECDIAIKNHNKKASNHG